MPNIDPLLGRENEYSLSIVPRHSGLENLPDEDDCIIQMLLLLRDEFGAYPMTCTGLPENLRTLLPRIAPHKVTQEADDSRSIAHIVRRGFMLSCTGRIYREVANPYFEISSIHNTDPFELTRRTRRGEAIFKYLLGRVGHEDYIVRGLNAVSDRKGGRAKSCGMHGNYLISREQFIRIHASADRFARKRQQRPEENLFQERYSLVAQDLMSLRVLGIIFWGEGKVGNDLYTEPAPYQMSGRADFIQTLMGGDTEKNRPILNMRDEPHADGQYFARYHVINGEGNRAPWSMIFDPGLTSLTLLALHNDAIRLGWRLKNPLEALRTLSRDVRLEKELEIVDRKHNAVSGRRGVDLLSEFARELRRWASWAHVPWWTDQVLAKTEEMLWHLSRGDPEHEAARTIDWCIKKRFIKDYMDEKIGINPDSARSWGHPRVAAVDLEYHRLDDTRMFEGICENYEVVDAQTYREPYGNINSPEFFKSAEPEHTRSHLVWFLAHHPEWKKRLLIDDWDRIFLWSKEPKHKVGIYLLDPRRFGKTHVEFLTRGLDFSQARDRKQFIELLKQEETREYLKEPDAFHRPRQDTVHRVPRGSVCSPLSQRPLDTKAGTLEVNEKVEVFWKPLAKDRTAEMEGEWYEPEDLADRSLGILERRPHPPPPPPMTISEGREEDG